MAALRAAATPLRGGDDGSGACGDRMCSVLLLQLPKFSRRAAPLPNATVYAPAKRGDNTERKRRLLAPKVAAEREGAVLVEIKNAADSVARLCGVLGNCTSQ